MLRRRIRIDKSICQSLRDESKDRTGSAGQRHDARRDRIKTDQTDEEEICAVRTVIAELSELHARRLLLRTARAAGRNGDQQRDEKNGQKKTWITGNDLSLRYRSGSDRGGD